LPIMRDQTSHSLNINGNGLLLGLLLSVRCG